MTSNEHQHYFREARSCFFRWEDNGNVMVWDNGLTIAFRAEIAAVMQRLAPECLPPLNAIAVLLSACRENWGDARQVLSQLSFADAKREFSRRHAEEPSWKTGAIEWFVRELNRVHALPLDLRSDLGARCELAAMIFENCSRRSQRTDATEALALAEQMARGLPEALESKGGLLQVIDGQESDNRETLAATSISPVIPDMTAYIRRDAAALIEDLHWLQGGLRGVTESSLRRRLQTGIEEEVQPAEQSETESSRSLIGQLMQDAELGALARLARDLLAVLTFPRPLSQPEELSLGGVSDITNRGQLDRLLLSELAHDDLTLATRIALGEALYLHRESPPAARSQYRRVLLDTGLCMWGIPRVFATAVGLSMAATADHHVYVDVSRFDGKQLHDVDLTTREGLQQQLEVLHPELHPGAALPGFFGAQDSPDVEYIIVTHEDVAEDQEFRKHLRDHLPHAPTFVVSVARTGQLTLTSINQHGTRVLRTGLLRLDEILKPTTTRRPLHDVDSELPVILRQDRFPLRMHHQVSAERGFRSEQGLLMCTGDGRLMLWDKPGCGAVQLTDKLGKGRIFWCGTDPYGVPQFVFGQQAASAMKLVRVHEDGNIPMTSLSFAGTPGRVSGYGGYVFVEFPDRWEMFRSGRSERIAVRNKTPDMPQSFGPPTGSGHSAAARFVLCGTAWCALTEQGGEIYLQVVPLAKPQDVFALFDRRGYGIVALHLSGKVQRLYGDETGSSHDFPSHLLAAVSPDGSIFVVGNVGQTHPQSVAVATDTFHSYAAFDACEAVVPTSDCAVTSLRKKFQGIAVRHNQLYLRSGSGTILAITHDGGITLSVVTSQRLPDAHEFRPAHSPEGCKYRLQVATWPCGSQAFLDSRGLLHLVSCNPDVPQISLVLHEGRMSGWCESGGAFGVAYCMPDGEETSVQHDMEIYVKAIEEFARCVSLD
jgi:hypothetical protein